MEAIRIGIREFRDKLASYLLSLQALWQSRGTGIRSDTTSPRAAKPPRWKFILSVKPPQACRRCLRPAV